ncbi:hypothetical protein GCM10010331_16540 [Streptomyces xanthochromogenes]|uniref:hypothetical protein n=1 Tax=Streptomyces xanthochromogenes TaxID=67384 RepID=UPI00167B1275|nr:hypothetical protein GCM10010331_16540 [Streptomyces xanthochromogenes]
MTLRSDHAVAVIIIWTSDARAPGQMTATAVTAEYDHLVSLEPGGDPNDSRNHGLSRRHRTTRREQDPTT